MKNKGKILWRVAFCLYAPIYIVSWGVHKIARLLLAISYFGLGEFRKGRDIIQYLFKKHGRH